MRKVEWWMQDVDHILCIHRVKYSSYLFYGSLTNPVKRGQWIRKIKATHPQAVREYTPSSMVAFASPFSLITGFVKERIVFFRVCLKFISSWMSIIYGSGKEKICALSELSKPIFSKSGS